MNNQAPDPYEIMLQRRVAELEKQNARMRQLGTMRGFFNAFFNALPYHETQKEAFEIINTEYYELWGIYRYTSYEGFKNARNRYNQSTRKKQ